MCMGWLCGTCKVSTSPRVLSLSQGFLFAKKTLYTLAIPPTFFLQGKDEDRVSPQTPYVVGNDLELPIFLIAPRNKIL